MNHHKYFQAVCDEVNRARPERHARVDKEDRGIYVDALDHPEDVHWCISPGSEFWSGATSDNLYGFMTTIEKDEREWLPPHEMAECILVSLAKYVRRIG